jgi:nucleotide-binding universal stress UspA family protein
MSFPPAGIIGIIRIMRRILITIDGSANDRDSLASAATVAGMTGAALTVVHPRPAASRVRGFGETVHIVDDDSEAGARAAFDAACGALPDARFATYEAEADAVVAWLGHAHDLVLVERLSREEGPAAEALNAALFDTGRPVLLLPPAPVTAAFRRPVLAWNGTAAASRAIRSALPLLAPPAAPIVLVGSGAGRLNPALLVEYLASHGIAAEVAHYNSERLTARARGRALLAAAEDQGADLLVAGAYGEAADGSVAGLGRATRKLVTAAWVPLLLQS